MRKAFVGLLVFFLSCGCVSVPKPPPISQEAPDTFVLRHGFSPNEERRYVLRSSYVSHTLVEPVMTLSAEHEAEFHVNVVEVLPGDRARVAVTIDRVRFVTSPPGQETVVFDSDDGDTIAQCPQEMRGIMFLIGKKVEMERTCWGEIARVGGLASIYRIAMAELSSDERPRVERFLKEMAHNPSTLLGLDVLLPARAIRPGESWSADTGPFPLFCGRLAYKCDYLLKGVADGQAVVQFRGGTGASEPQPDSKLRQVGKSDVKGAFFFDTEKGVLMRMRGESSSFLRIGDSEQLRKKCTWELISGNTRSLQETENIANTDEEKLEREENEGEE
jgi:hypothetical protein